MNVLAEFAAAHGTPLTETQIQQFQFFEKDLYVRNEVMNLTRVPREEAVIRHFIDSLIFVDLLEQGDTLLDLGTGPGFPAWPIACARLDVSVTALDSNGKMTGFLRRHLLSNLEVVQARAEEWEDHTEKFSVVTGRAVAPLPIHLEISARFATVGGRILPLRTPAELDLIRAFPADELGLELEGELTRALPGTDIVRLVPIFRKVAATPVRYPRSWAEIKRNPIGSVA